MNALIYLEGDLFLFFLCTRFLLDECASESLCINLLSCLAGSLLLRVIDRVRLSKMAAAKRRKFIKRKRDRQMPVRNIIYSLKACTHARARLKLHSIVSRPMNSYNLML